MTALLPRLFSDMNDWFDFDLMPRGGYIRMEEFLADKEYQLRAELPGLDPEKDITVSVHHGMLTIRAERREDERTAHRSEFRYGLMQRTVRLPAGAEDEKVSAKYDKGVLTVTVPIAEPQPTGRTIPIKP
jgi:HSP20 family molecular chaperone IbpA